MKEEFHYRNCSTTDEIPFPCDCSAQADYEAEVTRLNAELQQANENLIHLDNACWYCANPDIEDPWRHEHEPNGGHWHHCIDPGDGLPSECANSDRLERVFQELQEENEGLKAELQGEREAVESVKATSLEMIKERDERIAVLKAELAQAREKIEDLELVTAEEITRGDVKRTHDKLREENERLKAELAEAQADIKGWLQIKRNLLEENTALSIQLESAREALRTIIQLCDWAAYDVLNTKEVRAVAEKALGA